MKQTENRTMRVAQPVLGTKGTIALIAAMNSLPPLSTDMYLPALPGMGAYFATTDAVMNMTMSGFFLFFALSMLLLGPLSDRFGRRPLLLAGTAGYIAASLICALSQNVAMLIVFRVFQATGAGAMVAASVAMIKDCFEGSTQARVLSITQILGVLAPIVSPLIGAALLRVFIWRAVFVTQALVAGLLLAATLAMRETRPQEEAEGAGIGRVFGNMGRLMRNRVFALFLGAMVFTNMPTMAYITTSSLVYENYFGLSAQAYSFFFAVTALVSSLGAVLYLRLQKVDPVRMSVWLLASGLAAGVLILVLGHAVPLAYMVFIAVMMVIGSLIRPFSTYILLNLQPGEAGVASALINFSNSLLGALGMILVTALWQDYITGVGVMQILACALGLVFVAALVAKEGRTCLSQQ